MRCFSLVAGQEVIAVPPLHFPVPTSVPTVHVAPELYPKVASGIAVLRNSMYVWLGNESVQVSRRFLNADASVEHVVQGEETVTVLRASLVRHADDSLELIPERKGDESGALLLLDPGAGSYSSVRYQNDIPEILLRTSQRSGIIFGGRSETALALLRPGRSLSAYRTEKPWVFFGEDVLREELRIDFDGSDLGYKVINVSDANAD